MQMWRKLSNATHFSISLEWISQVTGNWHPVVCTTHLFFLRKQAGNLIVYKYTVIIKKSWEMTSNFGVPKLPKVSLKYYNIFCPSHFRVTQQVGSRKSKLESKSEA